MTPQEAKDKIDEILSAVSQRAERYYLEDTWIRWGKVQRDINDVIDRLSHAGADAAPVVVPARRELALAGMRWESENGIVTIWYGDGDFLAEIEGNLGLGIDAEDVACFICNAANAEEGADAAAPGAVLPGAN